jgi:hypothetical protein
MAAFFFAECELVHTWSTFRANIVRFFGASSVTEYTEGATHGNRMQQNFAVSVVNHYILAINHYILLQFGENVA